MSGLEIFLAALSVASTICAIFFGYAAFRRSRKKDDTDHGMLSGTILTEIGYIKANTEEIKRKQEKQDAQLLTVIERLAAAEQSIKNTYKRLDRLEGKKGE